jgi:peptidoglycan/xylan/chitin deacetylase (PgdA/CDA1 family)
MVVSVEDFYAQMRWLYENNFYTLTLQEMEAFIFDGRNLPHRSVAIHFDDGYYSNFRYAYPIMRDFGLRGAIFFITNEICALGDYQPEMNHQSITWTAAHTIEGTEAVFCTASHTHNLHHIRQGERMAALYHSSYEEIVADILRSFDFVENHTAFVYPRNHANANVVEALMSVGITHAFGGRQVRVTRRCDVFDLGRFTIGRGMSMERFVQILSVNM